MRTDTCTAVFIGGGTSRPGQLPNPLGHTAIAFSGEGVYSFGTGTDPGSSFTDFLNDEAMVRDSTVFFLNTTPEQEQEMIDYLENQSPDINWYPDNCAHRTSAALNAGGVAPPYLNFLDNGDWPAVIANLLSDDPGILYVSVPKGSILPGNFLTGFNPK
jgi:hypothetical protein